MVAYDLLMLFQADLLNVPVIRPEVTETTALGAAYAAGLAVGYSVEPGELRQNRAVNKTWPAQMDANQRRKGVANWHNAVRRTLNWVD